MRVINNCGECAKELKLKNEKHCCTSCKDIFCGRHIYKYIDESNCAITKNTPWLCKKCYKQKYK